MTKPLVETVSSVAQLEHLSEEWEQLASELSAGPFSMPAVAVPWWKHLGRGHLLVVVVRDGSGRLVGLAPLHERRIGGLEIVRWLGHGMGTVGQLLVRPGSSEVAEQVWAHLATSRRRVLQLVEYRYGGAGLDALRRSTAWTSHIELRDACPYIDLTGRATATDLLAEPGRRKLRQNMARVDRQLAELAEPLTIEVHTTPAAIEAVIADVTAIHDAAEAAHPRLHFLSEPYRDFTLDVLRGASRRGQLVAVVLRLGDRPVAFHVAIVTGRVASAWLARYDPVAADVAPGHVMLRAVVDWAAGLGLDGVDLQLGDDPYKLRWSSGTYDTLGVTAAQPSVLPMARSALATVDVLRRVRARARNR